MFLYDKNNPALQHDITSKELNEQRQIGDGPIPNLMRSILHHAIVELSSANRNVRKEAEDWFEYAQPDHVYSSRSVCSYLRLDHAAIWGALKPMDHKSRKAVAQRLFRKQNGMRSQILDNDKGKERHRMKTRERRRKQCSNRS